MSKKTTTPILNAYNALSSVSKEIVRDAAQKELGYSRATFYNKIQDENGLNNNEAKVISKIFAVELLQQISFSTEALNNLEKIYKYERKKQK